MLVASFPVFHSPFFYLPLSSTALQRADDSFVSVGTQASAPASPKTKAEQGTPGSVGSRACPMDIDSATASATRFTSPQVAVAAALAQEAVVKRTGLSPAVDPSCRTRTGRVYSPLSAAATASPRQSSSASGAGTSLRTKTASPARRPQADAIVISRGSYRRDSTSRPTVAPTVAPPRMGPRPPSMDQNAAAAAPRVRASRPVAVERTSVPNHLPAPPPYPAAEGARAFSQRLTQPPRSMALSAGQRGSARRTTTLKSPQLAAKAACSPRLAGAKTASEIQRPALRTINMMDMGSPGPVRKPSIRSMPVDVDEGIPPAAVSMARNAGSHVMMSKSPRSSVRAAQDRMPPPPPYPRSAGMHSSHV